MWYISSADMQSYSSLPWPGSNFLSKMFDQNGRVPAHEKKMTCVTFFTHELWSKSTARGGFGFITIDISVKKRLISQSRRQVLPLTTATITSTTSHDDTKTLSALLVLGFPSLKTNNNAEIWCFTVITLLNNQWSVWWFETKRTCDVNLLIHPSTLSERWTR